MSDYIKREDVLRLCEAAQIAFDVGAPTPRIISMLLKTITNLPASPLIDERELNALREDAERHRRLRPRGRPASAAGFLGETWPSKR